MLTIKYFLYIKRGFTGLHHACLNGNLTLVKLLINCKSDIEAEDFVLFLIKFGKKPLYFALKS
jgi:hypothetical protein